MKRGDGMDRYAESEYRRYTVVLREDKRNYAITPTKRPKGKATIEINGTKGVLRCSVKNLSPLKNGEMLLEYGLWLVREDTDSLLPVYTGSIPISKDGAGEVNWPFEAGDVRGTGLEIDLFTAVEVRVHTAHKDKPGDRVLTGQLELEEVNLPEDPKMEKVSPFGTGLPYYQWWKCYPGYFHDWMYYPIQPLSQVCSEVVNNFQTGPVFQGHQLVGLQYDQKGAVKYLVHGIPGRFCLRDQPYGGATGYIYWHPLPGQQYQAGDYGYWLIHINPITGEVVFPQRATKPPDCDQCNRSK